MRESILVYGLKNVLGGTENYLLSMQEQMKEAYKFIFLIEKCNCIHTESIRKNGGEIVFLESKSKILTLWQTTDRLLKKNRRKISYLYINVNDMTVEVLMLLLLGKKYHFHIITQSHNALQTPILSFTARMRHEVILKIGTNIINGTEIKRLAVSNRAGMYLYQKKNFELVSPGIEGARFAPDENIRKRTKEELHLDDKKIVGFVGRLVEVKNPLFALKVFSGIRLEHLNAHLVIVGDGELRSVIEERVRELNLEASVTFVGASNEVNRYMQAFDIMLSPSLSEGLPLTALEAQAAGIPIICAERNFPPEVKITPLVHFIHLEDNDKWSKMGVELLEKDNFPQRADWNKKFMCSKYELKNAGKCLKEIFDDSKDS